MEGEAKKYVTPVATLHNTSQFHTMMIFFSPTAPSPPMQKI